ncbi:MAG: family 1 glycosylhydrolase, partial [Clostridia bacterium]|nr:family 1 glycosylhydrolase [Clostridia bacterium]
MKYWITFNEPQMFMGLGHRLGMHAPGERLDDPTLIGMTRNILLAHGMATAAIRETLGKRVRIGMAPTGDCFLP